MRGRNRQAAGPRLLIIGHSASRSGSPKVLLNIVRWLSNNADFDITMALLEGGPLEDEYRACVRRLTVLDEPRLRRRAELAQKMLASVHLARLGSWARRRILDRTMVRTSDADLIYANSVASLRVLKRRPRSCPLVLHVHELPYAVEACLPEDVTPLVQLPDCYLAVSAPVRSMLIRDFGISAEQVRLVTECLSDEEARRTPQGKQEARTALGLEPDMPVVLGSGRIEWRKGFDIFLTTAVRATEAAPETPIRWCWVGETDAAVLRRARLEIEKAGLTRRVEILPAVADLWPLYEAADVFLLSSREDPYPLVVLEAALAERPVICQSDRAGGAADFVSRGAGLVAPYLDIDRLAEHVLNVIRHPAEAGRMGELGRHLVVTEHLTSQVAPTVLDALLQSQAASA